MLHVLCKVAPDLCLNLSRSAKAQCWWDPGQAEQRRVRCWAEGSLGVSRPLCREVNGCASCGEAVQMSAMPGEQTDFLVGNKSSRHHVRSRRWHPRSAAACWTGVTGALHRGLEASLQHAKRSRRVPQQRPNPLQPTVSPPPAHCLRRVANGAVAIRLPGPVCLQLSASHWPRLCKQGAATLRRPSARLGRLWLEPN